MERITEVGASSTGRATLGGQFALFVDESSVEKVLSDALHVLRCNLRQRVLAPPEHEVGLRPMRPRLLQVLGLDVGYAHCGQSSRAHETGRHHRNDDAGAPGISGAAYCLGIDRYEPGD